MNIFNKNKHKYYFILLSFLLLSFISDILMVRTNLLFSANDVQFHLKRIMELTFSIHKFTFSPFAFNYFHGSAVMGMYPYYSLIPLVLIYSITSSYIKSYFIFFMMITFLSLLISFLSSLRFSKSIIVSYLFAIVYSLSLLIFMDAFHDGDLGITTSLPFLPLAIFGFIDILNGSDSYIKLSLGIFFMSLCQIPTTIITIGFLLLWFLLNFMKIKYNIHILKNFLKGLILTIFLTSIIWIPMIEISLFNKMDTPGNLNVPLKKSDELSIIKNVGLPGLIIVPISLLMYKKFDYLLKQMLVISIIIIFVSSQIIPLKSFLLLNPINFINKFQFSSRFLIIPHFLLSYLTSYIFVRILKYFTRFKHIKIFTFVIVICICQLFGQNYLIHKNLSSSYRLANSYDSIRVINPLGNYYMIKNKWCKYLYNGYMNNDDYYPLPSSKLKFDVENNKGIYDNYHRIIHVHHVGYNHFLIDAPVRIKKLILPMVHYNHEKLSISLNHHLNYYTVSKNDLIMVTNLRKGQNNIKIKYIPNKLIDFIKFVTFLIGVIWVILILIEIFINTIIG